MFELARAKEKRMSRLRAGCHTARGFAVIDRNCPHRQPRLPLTIHRSVTARPSSFIAAHVATAVFRHLSADRPSY